MSLKRKAYYFLIGFFYFSFFYCLGQDQRIADSLAKTYQENDLQGQAKMELLKNLAFNELKDQQLSLKYADELIQLATSENNLAYLYSGYLQRGSKYLSLGNIENALENYFKCIEIATVSKDVPDLGTANMAVADAYAALYTFNNAEIYYDRAIKLLRETQDSIALASALLNAGDAHFNNKKYDQALDYFTESELIFKKINYLPGIAYNLGNAGMVYAVKGIDDVAEANINEAIDILESQKDYYPISVYLTYIADIYVSKGNLPKAFEYAHQSLELAEKYKLKQQISEANLKLSELYDLAKNKAAALDYYKAYIVYRDSVKNLETVQKIADLRTDSEVSQKQAEVDLLTQKRKTQRIIVYATLLALFLIGLLALGLFKRNRFVRATNKIIAAEKQRSDKLLLNILPEETAQELKDNGRVEAKRFESVTVLFTDFKGFTHYAEHLSPEKLVATVDFYFSKFDAIIEKYGLEKIKTVGDAYMCAGGLPFPTKDHAVKMVMAAQEIIDFVHIEKNNTKDSETRFDIRVGINTGPVVAGVVGSKKFAYDIWGDTVNIASRMESCSEPGKINISEHTYLLVKDKFNCNFRGNIEVKNRGQLKMYFVNNHITTT
ncbi:adenylate/guanylate cyclase domain-containing protein [Geojedonia litorea]|uniref:Adenylate/guanylate cyclase domain-containing protein n=1 Tax=Geojedonia litorea TaxID=1268269 RepID=A0ABV9N3V8_9FLAO